MSALLSEEYTRNRCGDALAAWAMIAAVFAELVDKLSVVKTNRNAKFKGRINNSVLLQPKAVSVCVCLCAVDCKCDATAHSSFIYLCSLVSVLAV